jgi:hypothetical protein
MMRPFDDDEERVGSRGSNVGEHRRDNQREGSEVGKDEEENLTISEGEEEEGIKVAIRKTERAPSTEEVAMHMVNHIPFRSWCSHCVKGRAHGNQHRRRKVMG